MRRELGAEPPRYRGARFAVALTHDVDVPWRWTRIGVLGAAARLKGHALAGRVGPALHEASGLARVPVHKLRGTDPNWRFAEIAAEEREHDAPVRRSSCWPATATVPTAPRRRRTTGCGRGSSRRCSRPGAEVGLHGSYLAADELDRLARERVLLAQLDGPLLGHRYHYLRVDPHRNLVPLAGLGFRYDTSLGFPDALGFRAGIAHPFRPWDFARDQPGRSRRGAARGDGRDARRGAVRRACRRPRRSRACSSCSTGRRSTAAASRSSGIPSASTRRARAAGTGSTSRLIDAVRERGGVCLSAGELAGLAAERFGLPRD